MILIVYGISYFIKYIITYIAEIFNYLKLLSNCVKNDTIWQTNIYIFLLHIILVLILYLNCI
jgi:hypothetical protein